MLGAHSTGVMHGFLVVFTEVSTHTHTQKEKSLVPVPCGSNPDVTPQLLYHPLIAAACPWQRTGLGVEPE